MLEYDEVSRYRVVQTCTQFGCKRMKHVWCKQLLPTQMLSEQHLSHSWIQKPANYANLETARNWKPGKAGNSNDSGKKCRKQSKNEQIWQNTQRMVDAWCSGLLAFSAIPAFPGFFFVSVCCVVFHAATQPIFSLLASLSSCILCAGGRGSRV